MRSIASMPPHALLTSCGSRILICCVIVFCCILQPLTFAMSFQKRIPPIVGKLTLGMLNLLIISGFKAIAASAFTSVFLFIALLPFKYQTVYKTGKGLCRTYQMSKILSMISSAISSIRSIMSLKNPMCVHLLCGRYDYSLR